jgi:hypothetical protein
METSDSSRRSGCNDDQGILPKNSGVRPSVTETANRDPPANARITSSTYSALGRCNFSPSRITKEPLTNACMLSHSERCLSVRGNYKLPYFLCSGPPAQGAGSGRGRTGRLLGPLRFLTYFCFWKFEVPPGIFQLFLTS